MLRTAEYQARAFEAELRAREATTSDERRSQLALAQCWRHLAEQAMQISGVLSARIAEKETGA